MNKRLLLPTLTLGLATGYGIQQDAKGDLGSQVGALQQRLEAVEGYLAAQVEADRTMLEAIERSVAKGFTAGINFEARQILVDAWRARTGSAARKVPGQKEPAPAKPTDPRQRGR